MITAVDLATRLGVTHRQLNYWIRVGLLQPEDLDVGTGYPHLLPRAEAAVATRMARLVRAGVSLRVAHAIARNDREARDRLTSAIWGET